MWARWGVNFLPIYKLAAINKIIKLINKEIGMLVKFSNSIKATLVALLIANGAGVSYDYDLKSLS